MEPERDEVYERIPWETLEKRSGDRQWLVYAIAGAVTLGALAYSFTRNQPVSEPAVAVAPVVSTFPATTIASNMDSPPSTVASPIVVAEADLYAVDPERLIDRAAAHAEWFAMEFTTVDGSDESRRELQGLLPGGIPLPEAPEGTQVYVDWVRATQVTQTGPTSFDVEVLVRSLSSTGEEGFSRRPTEVMWVPVSLDDDGAASVTSAPRMAGAPSVITHELPLGDVPADVAAEVDAGDIVGGFQGSDGGWNIVVMAEDPSGVRRPLTVSP